MLYKRKLCPECDGNGYITGFNDNSIWSGRCSHCNGEGFLLDYMTNGDVIRAYSTNKNLTDILWGLSIYVIFSGGEIRKSLDKEDPGAILDWLNKITDEQDLKTIFSFIDVDEHNAAYLESTTTVCSEEFLRKCKETASKYEKKEV